MLRTLPTQQCDSLGTGFGIAHVACSYIALIVCVIYAVKCNLKEIANEERLFGSAVTRIPCVFRAFEVQRGINFKR